MKVVIFAVIAFAMVSATTLSTTPATAQDKCFTQEGRDTGELLTGCSEFSADQDQLKESKKECKETAEETNSKCTGSQTGQGEFGNFFKPSQED